jgi:restriction endonuclease S subunit
MNVADRRYAIGRGLAAIRAMDGKADTDFIQQVLEHQTSRLLELSVGSTFPSIDRKSIGSFPVGRFELGEQRAIAAVLSTWDRGIRQLSDLIAAKLRFKQGLMQQLLTGKRAFAEFDGVERSRTRLGDVLIKLTDPIKVQPELIYREIGIRSHGKGIFHKEPVSGESLGDKRVYPVIPGCLTLNIVFAWERALAVTTEQERGMVASHRFPMFRSDRERLLPEYALQYLLSQKGNEVLQLASPGGAGRNRTLSQTTLLKTAIPLPSIDEQRRIVAFVETADREIDLLRRQLDALKTQKKGLMQKLLTGQVRVPVSGGRQSPVSERGGTS